MSTVTEAVGTEIRCLCSDSFSCPIWSFTNGPFCNTNNRTSLINSLTPFHVIIMQEVTLHIYFSVNLLILLNTFNSCLIKNMFTYILNYTGTIFESHYNSSLYYYFVPYYTIIMCSYTTAYIFVFILLTLTMNTTYHPTHRTHAVHAVLYLPPRVLVRARVRTPGTHTAASPALRSSSFYWARRGC